MKLNGATSDEIVQHLTVCSEYFSPPLDTRVIISDYARKLRRFGTSLEKWNENRLVGLVVAYFNSDSKTVFVSSVSVLPDFQGRGIATELMENLAREASRASFSKIRLKVSQKNTIARKFYTSLGFRPDSLEEIDGDLEMLLQL